MSKRAWTGIKKQKNDHGSRKCELQGKFDGSRTVNLEKSGLKHESSFQTYAIRRKKIIIFPHMRRTRGN